MGLFGVSFRLDPDRSSSPLSDSRQLYRVSIGCLVHAAAAASVHHTYVGEDRRILASPCTGLSTVTPSNRPYASFSDSRQTRIETIQRCQPGTFVRVENEVITLHNSPRWDPQNKYIYNSDSMSQEYRYNIQRSKSP